MEQMALLARRLVEAGVTFVTLNTAPDSLCWDWHRHIVNDNRPADGSDGPTRGMDISGPPLDRMLSTLIADLYERGLDRKVLLVGNAPAPTVFQSTRTGDCDEASLPVWIDGTRT